MTVVELALLGQVAATVGTALGTVLFTGRVRNVLAGAMVMTSGIFGCLSGGAALGGQAGLSLLATPVSGLSLAWSPTPMGGFFTLVAGAVAVTAALFGIGYAHGPSASRTTWIALAVFVLGLQLVPMAGDVVAFLVAWEVMALGSTVLVLTEHGARPSVRSAGLWYAAMTHLSFLLVGSGLAVLAAAAGSSSFETIAQSHLGGPTATAGFVLAVVGFAAKSGAYPLHVWLPRAHPEAPSHVSALMSAAMVKMGIYGVLLLTQALLPRGPGWWGLLILGFGLPSALYGILGASVTSDLKRLLAYSTTENIGLILTAIAVSMLTRDSRPGVSATALVAAYLLVVSHAAFKAVLFFGAGAILHATGERDLDRMGGLWVRMPVSMSTMAIGALGAAALPVTSGFVAEWTLLQALIHADARTDRLTTALLPLVMGVVALTAGLALLTFTKVVGVAALARPRSSSASSAREVSLSMQAAQAVAAVAVLGLGLLPGLIVARLAGVVPAGALPAEVGVGLSLPEVQAQLDPVALTLLVVGLTVPVLGVAVVQAARAPRRRVELGWGCGGVRTSPRMQYTATSYAEPLLRVFDDALAPSRDVSVSHTEESGYAVREMTYRQELGDVVETRAYRPIVAVLLRIGDRARTVQNGDIHRYLAFSFAALLLVLVGLVT